jgi:hypothetical protein
MSDLPTRVDLSEEGLIAEARAATGLRDLGEDGFREGLRVLLATYESTARLSPRGRKATRRRLIELLTNRLLIQETLRLHPEIRERAIRRPVYLTGLPRTGTSALFNLLGADPASRPLLLWEGRNPQPLRPQGPASSVEPDPRFVALSEALDRARQQNPEFAKIHDARADGPEECVELLAHTMRSVMMGTEVLLSPYREWFQAQDLHGPYAYYRDLLKMLDWQRPGERWLLKSPAHLWALDILVEMFPDACIVQTHRNPLHVVGSYCSMMEALMIAHEGLDLHALGPTVLEYLARSVERAMAARAVADGRRFLDIDYRDIVTRPLETVERVHGAFGLPFGGALADGMAAHVRSHPKNKHGSHDYALERYGLTPGAVLGRLAAYIDRFGIQIDAEPSARHAH